ncbi:MAG: hypothetical protein IPG34_02620 [Rhodocyclaceae bacterium]|nr:hypothetical protein [Rhodocyclaceae bacterium]
MTIRCVSLLPRPLNFLFSALALLCVSPAWAFGLNNIYGGQTLGKPFYAEIPLQSAPSVSESCVNLRPGEGTADFFIADLKVTLAGPVNARRLVISSLSPVRSPMISFVVDVQCAEAAMAREYTLLAENAQIERLPRRTESVAVASPLSPPVVSSAALAPAGETLLLAGATTLNAMARALYPDDRAARDAYRAAFAASNPELFAGKENVGSVPLPAGTRLKAPAELPVAALPTRAKVVRVATPDAGSAAAAPSPSGQSTAKSTGATSGASKPESRKGDRLSLGTAASQMQMLADAIMRLEGTMIERDKVNAELVGGVSSALNSIIELKDRLGAQDKQVQQLIAMQIESERLRALEREAQLGPWTLLGLLLVAMVAGAGLVALNHALAARRRELVAPAFNEAVAKEAAASRPRDPWAQAADQSKADHDRFDDEPEPWPARPTAASQPPAVAATPQAAAPVTPEAAPAPVAVPVAKVAATPPAGASEPLEELELDDLFGLFTEQKAAVTSMISRLRATHSRDPDEWLALVREAREAGLLNTQELQLVLAQFKQVFNAEVTPHNSSPSLDTFPQVIKRLQACWGGGECLKMLNQLLYDNREGGRQGFPEDAFSDLAMLRDVLAMRIALYGEEAVHPSVTAELQAAELAARRAEHRAAASSTIDFHLELPPSKD